jgi:hypothetical protein
LTIRLFLRSATDCSTPATLAATAFDDLFDRISVDLQCGFRNLRLRPDCPAIHIPILIITMGVTATSSKTSCDLDGKAPAIDFP